MPQILVTGAESGAAVGQVNPVMELQRQLLESDYIADRSLCTALLLLAELGRPLLVEGDPGVGKTELAKALARVHGTDLIRLQCYEGLDVHHALYEWNYQRQLLAIKVAEARHSGDALEDSALFSEKYLLARPLLQSIMQERAPVLLIDEVDRTDEAFEAFLLELLSDYQVTIPEFGTVRAKVRPMVVLTSNGTRELSDALRRRCLYQFLDYPSFDKEMLIVETRAPQLPRRLAQQVVEFVQALRQLELRKRPGIAETLDWAASLMRLGVHSLDEGGPERIIDTLTALLKTREDILAMTPPVVQRLAAVCR
ncbi:MAG: AAA family ATPase [Polaromonas sp.]